MEQQPELAELDQLLTSARDRDSEAKLTEEIAARRKQSEHPFRNFLANIPKNLGIGTYKGVVESIDSAPEIGGLLTPAGAVGAAASLAGGGKKEGEEPGLWDAVPLSARYPEVMGSVKGFTESWEKGDRMDDDLVQGITQFTLPFMGWLKAAGGVSNVSKTVTVTRGLAAEGAAAATAFAPHEARAADLVKMGRESETRFGTVLRAAAPDESLVNSYINYMTDRENEGELEGRFKNAVDAVTSSAAVAGLIKAAGITHKGLVHSMENSAPSSGGMGVPNQEGKIVFHGSKADFNRFDMKHLGTGEGNQSYGKGLYFADDKEVAGSYGGKLYTVDIPDEDIGRMLDWDKPLSEQPHVLEALGVDPKAEVFLPNRARPEMTGQELYAALSQGRTNYGVLDAMAASAFLREKGVPGIRFLDGASRQKGKGTSNTVLFDDKRAEIKKKD